MELLCSELLAFMVSGPEVGGAEWSCGCWLLASSFWLLAGQCGSEVGRAEWFCGCSLVASGF